MYCLFWCTVHPVVRSDSTQYIILCSILTIRSYTVTFTLRDGKWSLPRMAENLLSILAPRSHLRFPQHGVLCCRRIHSTTPGVVIMTKLKEADRKTNTYMLETFFNMLHHREGIRYLNQKRSAAKDCKPPAVSEPQEDIPGTAAETLPTVHMRIIFPCTALVRATPSERRAS